jgi:hypothetical protein
MVSVSPPARFTHGSHSLVVCCALQFLSSLAFSLHLPHTRTSDSRTWIPLADDTSPGPAKSLKRSIRVPRSSFLKKRVGQLPEPCAPSVIRIHCSEEVHQGVWQFWAQTYRETYRAIDPSKSGLMNKHIVKHIGPALVGRKCERDVARPGTNQIRGSDSKCNAFNAPNDYVLAVLRRLAALARPTGTIDPHMDMTPLKCANTNFVEALLLIRYRIQRVHLLLRRVLGGGMPVAF